jgi:hypothetical protein
MEFPPSPETSRASSDVPYVTASQASALLKSGLAISNELIGAAFPEITKQILEELTGKWDFDVGSPLVQRHLGGKSDQLYHAFMTRLQETQDQYFTELTVGRVQPATGSLDAETLSLVDSISVESNTVVERHASKVAGYADQLLRDLNLVVAFLLGRSAVRNSENPLGPAVYVRALLRPDTDLHKEAWEFYLSVFEKLPVRTGAHVASCSTTTRITTSTCARFGAASRRHGERGSQRPVRPRAAAGNPGLCPAERSPPLALRRGKAAPVPSLGKAGQPEDGRASRSNRADGMADSSRCRTNRMRCSGAC